MAKYKIAMERWVQQTGTIELEAESAEDAADEASGYTENENVVWEQSDTDEIIWGSAIDVGNDCVYHVVNVEDPNETWERD